MSPEHCFSLPRLTAVMKRLCLVSVFVLCCFYNKEPQCSVITQHKFYDLPVSEVRSPKRVLRGENPGIDKAVFLSRASRGRHFCPFQLPEIAPFLVGGSLPSSKPAVASQVFLSLPHHTLTFCPVIPHLKNPGDYTGPPA